MGAPRAHPAHGPRVERFRFARKRSRSFVAHGSRPVAGAVARPRARGARCGRTAFAAGRGRGLSRVRQRRTRSKPRESAWRAIPSPEPTHPRARPWHRCRAGGSGARNRAGNAGKRAPATSSPSPRPRPPRTPASSTVCCRCSRPRPGSRCASSRSAPARRCGLRGTAMPTSSWCTTSPPKRRSWRRATEARAST